MRASYLKDHCYIISSERSDRRWDEKSNELYSDNEYEVGQWITFDGLEWLVEEVLF